ncbi:MAG: hypothetical protein ABFD89_02035 [Bryobacteraceae bacterium]
MSITPVLLYIENVGRTPVKRRPGRPPAGIGKDGKPEMTSKYPKLSIAIRPSTKAALSAVATLEDRPVWLIVEDGIRRYIEGLTPEDRRIVDAIASRVVENKKP